MTNLDKEIEAQRKKVILAQDQLEYLIEVRKRQIEFSFIYGYLGCAEWAEDKILKKEEKYELKIQAKMFFYKHYDLLEKAFEIYGARKAGHDFWLSRNGHGAGFWDGELPEELGNVLTQAAKEEGNVK